MCDTPPQAIDVKSPKPCQFCDGTDMKTKALIMPWKRNEGWWSCMECKDKATRRMSTLMNDRRIIGIQALPDWFREWGLFSVLRSNGELSDMILIDFSNVFSQNSDYADEKSVGGRVRLTYDKEPDIYLDMCSPDMRNFKQVKLQNVLENNPGLLDASAGFVFSFPSYVSSAMQREWNESAQRSIQLAKKKVSTAKESISEATDNESDVPEPIVVSEEPAPEPATVAKAKKQISDARVETKTIVANIFKGTTTPAVPKPVDEKAAKVPFSFW
jgi:hypothetical protein